MGCFNHASVPLILRNPVFNPVPRDGPCISVQLAVDQLASSCDRYLMLVKSAAHLPPMLLVVSRRLPIGARAVCLFPATDAAVANDPMLPMVLSHAELHELRCKLAAMWHQPVGSERCMSFTPQTERFEPMYRAATAVVGATWAS